MMFFNSLHNVLGHGFERDGIHIHAAQIETMLHNNMNIASMSGHVSIAELGI